MTKQEIITAVEKAVENVTAWGNSSMINQQVEKTDNRRYTKTFYKGSRKTYYQIQEWNKDLYQWVLVGTAEEEA